MNKTTMDIHCCEMMKMQTGLVCDQHPDPWDCGDALVFYSETFDEYGLIVRDGGRSVLTIDYCPFCGTQLRASRRDQWYSELIALGFDDPNDQEIPAAYESDSWYRKKDAN